MQLTPAQAIIAKDTHRFRVIDAGRRFGKSTLISWEMFGIAVANADARVPYYAPTRDDARDIMWSMLKKVADPLILNVNEGRLEITVRNKFGGESQMLLYGWEAVQQRGKGVGVKNNHIYLDEVAKYRNFQKGWDEILRPTLTDLAGGATFISTPNGFNHFYDLYQLENKDKDYKSFHFTSYDNPHLPVEEIEKARKELTEDRFAQEYMADFRKTEGLVYKEFDRNTHTYSDDEYEEDIDAVKIMTGVDFGFHNPAVVLTVKKDGDSMYWVDNELYKTGMTDAQIGDYTAAVKSNECYPDPESAGGVEELKRRGVNVREVIKGKDSVKNGIDTVREAFKQGKIMINRDRCPNLIWELETYHYAERRPDHNENENPVKEDDHAVDALRYIISMDQKSYPQTLYVYKPTFRGYKR